MKCKALFLLLAGTTFFNIAKAQFDGGIPDPYTGKVIGLAAPGGTIGFANGAHVEVTCPAGNSAEIVASRKIVNVIRLVLYEETTKYLSSDFTASVPVQIEYGPNSSSTNSITQTFSISYSKTDGVKYNAKNYFSFEGAQYVKVTIADDVNPPSAGGVSMADILYVENEMRITRYFDLQPNVSPASFSGPASVTNPVDAVPVSWSWPSNAGNNATQLEWTWLENELAPGYYIPNTTNVDIEKLFRDNATRMDLPYGKNNFNIPLFYDGDGKIYYRIRPVNIQSNGSRSDGNWTIPASGAGICSYGGHNNALNWQARTSFAEEGKMKSVMEYYDGSLRSRQTVTKENVNNTTVTAETFYDYEGRPAIQLLPAAGINSVIKHQASLNLFNTQTSTQSPAEFFDLSLNTANGADLYATTALSVSGGTSRYYSGSNDEKTTGANKFIPDAEGYPYTVTRYTPDGTGRIMAQSGVGSAHKMASGRETKYYYGTPSQEELDGLFGTEVGYKSHYFKNMVRDANGQMSISYVDMHGRTIATALAGNSPGNLLDINNNDQLNYPNQNGTSITRNLIDNNTNIPKGNAIESISTLMVPAANTYTFKYQLTPESLNLNDCNNAPVCYECLYDLEISITDESGEQAPYVFTYKNLTVSGDIDDACNTHNPFIKVCEDCPDPINNLITIVRPLEPGSYSIRKTLTLSESSLQKYKDLFLQSGKGICKTEQQIIDSVYSVLQASSGCNNESPFACDACLAQLGDFETFRENYLVSAGEPGEVSEALELEIQKAFDEASERCNSICNTTSSQLLVSKRKLMLADMMPYGGQYATESPINTTNGTSMYDKYNIFSIANSELPFYREPLDANQQLDFYRNNSNEVDLQIHPGGESDDYGLLFNTSKEEFTNQFVNNWAEALLPHHPEYQRLLFAENTLAPANVYNWISAFNNTQTYVEASAAGYITNPADTDPFYTIAGSSYKNAMDGWVEDNYYSQGFSMWQMARGAVKCKNDNDPAGCYNTGSNNKVPPFADVTSPEEKDQMWQMFRNLYSAAREGQVNNYIVEQIPLSPSTDDAALIDQGYQLRFGKNTDVASQYQWNWYSSTPVTTPTGIPTTGLPASTMTQTYTSRCHGYIEQWRQALLQCTALANKSAAEKEQILDDITSGMEAVCIKGSDALNPYGSSTVDPSTSVDGSPRSFEEVVNQVFSAHGISKDYYCNPFVIEFPKPYAANPVVAKGYTALLDSCACACFDELSSEAIANEYDPASLSSMNAFLELKYHDVLSEEFHEALQHCSEYLQFQCDGTGHNCHYVFIPHFFSTPQPLPEFLKCGFEARECLSCDNLADLTNEFKTLFTNPYNAGPVFTATDLSFEQIEQNNLFSRFLNFRTGFQYSWMQYAQAAAAANCSGLTGGVVDLVVTSRSGNMPSQYIASNSITLLPNFESGSNDQFETLIQPASSGSQGVICPDPRTFNDGDGIFAFDEPCHRAQMLAISIGQNIYRQRLSALQADFERQYREKCMAAKNLESFTLIYGNKEYHYTLYYYDMAGNLLKTVPPKGVNPNYNTSVLTSVKTQRDNCKADDASCTGTAIVPTHSLVTQYRYNSLNGVVAQNSPDAGISKFWYDRLGRLVVSQNAQQALDNKFSYTLYDPLGRITEVGQKPQTTAMTQTISQDDNALNNWIANTGSVREQVTYTGYDLPFGYPQYPNGIFYGLGLNQQNLRNRVSFTYTKNLATDGPTPLFYTGSFYSYDIHGNVDTLLQDYGGVTEMQSSTNTQKRIVYDYDLVSGKVNRVSYQPDWFNSEQQVWVINTDKFFHQYKYDAENRLTEVQTSRDKIEWERDAAYNYYKHGPFSRAVLGQLQVQGLDYAYTIQGWLKGVNATAVGDGNYDMGGDGVVSGANSKIARDIYGFGLHYFDDGISEMDYKPIDNTAPSVFARPNNAAFVSLYNGNIAGMSVNNAGLLKGVASSTNTLPLFYNYRYDQLNRIKSMNVFKGLNATNQWIPVALSPNNDYGETISYDPNGNIKTYSRNATGTITPPTGYTGGAPMDDLSYEYYPNTNRLKRVTDNVSSSAWDNDINTQTNASNYTYDAVGNLKTDDAEGITTPISWTVYGKIANIVKNGNTISYTYDAAGNRITKTANGKTTIYVRDGSGNVMSVYEKPTGDATVQTEIHLYGSSRLGILNKLTVPVTTQDLDGSYGTAYISTFTRGEKNYELSNHLGNVLTTISDKKIQHDAGNGNTDYYTADVITANDYYPFGMGMPGRKFDAGIGYRYGFNGKEQDKDINSLTAYDYGFRIYNPALGRFLSVDPLVPSFPWYTPYQFAGNKPIYATDIDGLEEKASIYEMYSRSLRAKPHLKTLSEVETGEKPVEVNVTSGGRLTMGDQRKIGQQIIAQQNGTNTLEKNRPSVYFKNRQDAAIESLYEVGKMTDLNDAVVLGTSITRGKKNAINLDGTEAGSSGVNFAIAGIFVPIVSGSLVKEASTLIRGSIKIFKNGVEVLEDAVKIGKYGFKGTKAFNEIVKAVQAGGNIVANSKDEAIKFLREAFPDIADETGKVTSKYGYRTDDFVEEAKEGLKQGHQGWHINYYDKKSGIKGTILVDEPAKIK